MIRITAKQDGFRRCGVAHAAVMTEYPDDRFTPEELAVLESEPMLTVERLDDQAGDDDGPDPEKMTVKELKQALEERGVEVPSGAVKADLVRLYAETGGDDA